eukprot:c26305_g1_i1.p1 GENE.c26305_g1_i1~~c26305_g1_i1.p1  ORF type:complete len:338 (+),score=67.63 c26305_g1_i1:38-1015(+)
MKVVLFGATGQVGKELLKLLDADNAITEVIATTRSATYPGLEKLCAKAKAAQVNVQDKEQCAKLCEGAAIVVFSVGLPYDSRVWAREFPPALRNVLDATPAEGICILVDNLYMLGPENVRKGIPMNEEMPMTSFRGKPRVRTEMDNLVMQHKGSNWAIVRASDFYGPGVVLSATGAFILQKMCEGKTPQILLNGDKPHALTYVPDVAKCVLAIAKKKEAWNQVFHCPNPPTITMREFVAKAAETMQLPRAPKAQVLPRWLAKSLGVFNRPLHEVVELDYQWMGPYLVDHSKFLTFFPELEGSMPTPWDEGMRESVKWFSSKYPAK